MPARTYELRTFLGTPLPVELARRVASFSVEGSSLLLACETLRFAPEMQDYYGTKVETVFAAPTPGRPATLRFDVATPHTIRLRYAPDGTPEPEPTPMLVGALPGVGDLDVVERDGTIVVDTGAVTIVVHRDPLDVEVRDADGRSVFRTRTPDLDAFGRVTGEWNPHELRWTFLTRYAYPLGCVDFGDRRAAFASFELRHDEAIYGFGEGFGRLDKHGTRQQLWLQEAFSNSSPAAYKQCPLYTSTRGYGLFVHTSNALAFDVGELDRTAVSVVVEDTEHLDLFLFSGPSIKEVLPRYTALTGAPAVPPRWSFGLWMGRITYRSQREVEDVARELREHRIPCDVIHLDTGWFADEYVCDLAFDPVRFPDPRAMCQTLADLGFKLSVWQWPNYNVGSPLYEQGSAAGHLAKRSSGHTYTMAGGYGEDAGLVDWSDPGAVAWLGERFGELFDIGVAVIKADYGEGAPPDAIYAGVASEAMHNRYPLLYGQALWEFSEKAHGKGNALLWARSAWAGSQRYPVHWSGDGVARFEDLACVLRSTLSFGLSGFPFYSHDIGGFAGVPSPALYVRWAQLALFCSHARAHGEPPREPWAYGPQAEAIFRSFAELRYRLMPYIWTTALACGQTSLPMVRALVVDFQEDPTTHNIDDQFLFGEDLLIAPILDDGTSRRLYLPPGEWFDFWTKDRLAGGRFLTVQAPLDTMPIFVRAGAILPLGPAAQHLQGPTDGSMSFELYGPGTSGDAVVRDPVGDVRVSYVRRPDRLEVRVDGLRGAARVEVYGERVAVELTT